MLFELMFLESILSFYLSLCVLGFLCSIVSQFSFSACVMIFKCVMAYIMLFAVYDSMGSFGIVCLGVLGVVYMYYRHEREQKPVESKWYIVNKGRKSEKLYYVSSSGDVYRM